MTSILGEHQYLLNINVHIIDYIGLCIDTSTVLYIILICMYIHIYIYILYTRVRGIQLHATPSTHDFLQSTQVILTQKLPARCRLSWASQPFRIVQTADIAIATPAVSSRCSHVHSHMNEYSFCRKASIISTDFCNPNPVAVRLKKTPSLKYELHPAKHPKVDTVQIPCFSPHYGEILTCHQSTISLQQNPWEFESSALAALQSPANSSPSQKNPLRMMGCSRAPHLITY